MTTSITLYMYVDSEPVTFDFLQSLLIQSLQSNMQRVMATVNVLYFNISKIYILKLFSLHPMLPSNILSNINSNFIRIFHTKIVVSANPTLHNCTYILVPTLQCLQSGLLFIKLNILFFFTYSNYLQISSSFDLYLPCVCEMLVEKTMGQLGLIINKIYWIRTW